MANSLLTPEDDGFHLNESSQWWTEGSWWCFFCPERRLAGWVYHLTRTTIGIASGGVWIWDDGATQWYEAPYFMNQTCQVVTRESDFTDMRWPDGVEMTVLEPLNRYRLRYDDRPALAIDLEYEAMMPAYETVAGDPPRVVRFEQPSVVKGTLLLHGESIPIDCVAMFDHSWGDRPEPVGGGLRRGASLDQLAAHSAPYLWGTASSEDAFFVMGSGGYLTLGGKRSALTAVDQAIRRRTSDGLMESMTVMAEDEMGRSFQAEGRPVNALVRPSAGSSVGFIYTMSWETAGMTAVGDVQDVWAVEDWAAYRRWTATT